MRDKPLVTVIIIFFNAERFLDEAIESIMKQTYENWELLLVDDGSTDRSIEIAQRLAAEQPKRIHYLSHAEHRNRGKGASRNLGISLAKGKYVAFLDADDIWLPYKLDEQVSILDTHKDAGMLYGRSLYWYSWTRNPSDIRRDYLPKWGNLSKIPFEPPNLLPLYLRGKTAVPCPSDILLRRSTLEEIGGFDETFVGVSNIYEDQAFFVKICLKENVIARDRCWVLYRQHSLASMAVAWQTGSETQARSFFLEWLKKYLIDEQGNENRNVWIALKREIWLIHKLPPGRAGSLIRWIRKWLVKLEEAILTETLSQKLWKV